MANMSTPTKPPEKKSGKSSIKKRRIIGIKRINSTNSALLVAFGAYILFGFIASRVVEIKTIGSAKENVTQELKTLVTDSAAETLFVAAEDVDSVMSDKDALDDFVHHLRGLNILGSQIYSLEYQRLAVSQAGLTPVSATNLKKALETGSELIKTDDSRLVRFVIPIKRGGLKLVGIAVVDYDWSRVLRQAANSSDWIWGGILASALVVTLALWLSFRAFNRELRKRHRALSVILDHAPIGIYTITRNGIIDSFNPKMVELAGIKSSESVLGMNAFKMESYKKSGLADRFRQAINDGKPFDVEVEYISSNSGKRSWRHYRGIPVFRPYSSQVDRILLLVEDITKQKDLEQKNTEYAEQLEKWAWDRTQRLVQTKEYLKNILSRIPVVIWTCDKEMKFTLSQGSGLKKIGLEDDEILGKKVTDVFPNNPEITDGITAALEGHENIFQSSIKDRHIQFFVSPTENTEGNVSNVTILALDITDRTQIEQKFAAMAANAPEITSLLDADGTVTYVTGPTKNVLGYSHEDLTGKKITDYIHPDDLKRFQQNWDDLIASRNDLQQGNMRIRNKNNEWVQIESVVQNHLSNPAISAVVMNCRDVSERIAAEEELKRRVKTEMAMATISAKLATSDNVDATVRDALKEIGQASHAKNVFFIELDENLKSINHEEWTEIGQGKITDTLLEAAEKFPSWQRTLLSEQTFCLPEIRGLSDDGIKDFLLNNNVSGSLVTRPVFDQNGLSGTIGMLIGEGRDDLESCDSQILLIAAEVLTSAVQRQKAFQTASLQAKQQTTVAAFGQTVITENDKNALMTAAVETVRNVLGAEVVGFYKYRSDENDFLVVSGIGWTEGTVNSASIPFGMESQAGFTMLAKQTTVVNDYSSDSRFNRSESLKASKAQSGICVIVGDSQNAWGIFGAHFLNKRTLTTNETGFVEAIAHLTGLGLNKINSQARVRELDNLKSKFIQIVSHQFRTPLSAARWNLESMLAGDVGTLTPEMRQFLRITHEATTEVIRRIRDLLTVLDIEERRITLNPATVSMESIVNSMMTEFQRRADLKKLTVTCDLPKEPLPAINIDQDRIRTALEKILDNSIVYTPAEGKISVSLKQVNKNLVITIADTGVGIPKTELPRIYDRFYRASNAAITKPDASGLGLTIAKHFIEQHSGSLTIESTEGAGTTALVKLPLTK